MIDIKRRVKNLVKKCGSANPYFIAGCMDIDVVYYDLPNSIRGFLVNVLKKRIIILNYRMSKTCQEVTLCHEIGHAVIHKGYGYNVQSDTVFYRANAREIEANLFAAYLLQHSYDLDADMFSRYLNVKKPDPKDVHRILAQMTNFI